MASRADIDLDDVEGIEDFKKAKKLLENKNVKAAINYLKSQINDWKNQEINCAVTGSSGAGKSSFVNAVRGLNDDDDNAAAVDVEECTAKPSDYKDTRNPLIVYSDLPGVGTPKIPRDGSYLINMNFSRYDFFLIFSDTRFTEDDKWLADEIKKLEKPFFFVRSKIDNDIRNNERKSITADVTKQKIKNQLENQLVGFSGSVYLISNHETTLHDFPQLAEDIIACLPKAKQEALIFTLQAFSVDMLKVKMKTLYKRSNIIAALSGVVAAIPVPGLSFVVDIGILVEEFIHYEKQLNIAYLPSSRVHIPLKEIMNKYMIKELVLKSLLGISVAVGLEEATRFIPFIGLFAAGVISFGTTRQVLQNRIKTLGEKAENFLKGINSPTELTDVMHNMES